MQIFRVAFYGKDSIEIRDFASQRDVDEFVTPVHRPRPDGSIRCVYAGKPGAMVVKIYPTANKDRFRVAAKARKFQRSPL